MTSIDNHGKWHWGNVTNYLSVVSTESEFYEKECVFNEKIRTNTSSTENDEDIVKSL